MLNPLEFMHELMYKLQVTYKDDSDKLNKALADLTPLANIDALKSAIKSDIEANNLAGNTPEQFLLYKCNIDLNNEDIGALIGYDASGGKVYTKDNIIDENTPLETHPSSAVIEGCTVTFPNVSTPLETFVLDGLYTWWIPLAFKLIKESLNLEISDTSYVSSLPVNLINEPPVGSLISLAEVETYYNVSTFETVYMELNINMNEHAYGSIIMGDTNGNTTNPLIPALDRNLAHELTHACMSANIKGGYTSRIGGWLPPWFIEGGTAELVVGEDDTRESGLLAAAADTTIIDSGFSDTPNSTLDWYTVGFLAMRYVLANYTEKTVPISFPEIPPPIFEVIWEKKQNGIRSEHCISRDGDLNKIMDEFIDFVQRDDYEEVQPWYLCANKGSKTLRIPVSGHNRDTQAVVALFDPDGSGGGGGGGGDHPITSIDVSDSVILTTSCACLAKVITLEEGVEAGISSSDSRWLVNNTDGSKIGLEFVVTPCPSPAWLNNGGGVSSDSYVNYTSNPNYGVIYDPNDYLSVLSNVEVDNFVFSNYYSIETVKSNAIDSIIANYNASSKKNIIVCVSDGFTFDMYDYADYNRLLSAIQSKVGNQGKLLLFAMPKVNMYDAPDYEDVQESISTYFPTNIEDYCSSTLKTYFDSKSNCIMFPLTFVASYVDNIDDYYWCKVRRMYITEHGYTPNIISYDLSPYTLINVEENLVNNFDSCFISPLTSSEDSEISLSLLSEETPSENEGEEGEQEGEEGEGEGESTDGVFVIDEVEDTDFPCFYLSTGVFSPNTWADEGLKYPQQIFDNGYDNYIPFNLHLLNDVGMRFDLQGMGTCKKVTAKPGDANLMYYLQPDGYKRKPTGVTDVLPGIGCPMIVYSQNNRQKYNTIMCYFTKTNYSGTFTLVFYDRTDELVEPIYQSIVFGMGTTDEESYKFPLYVGGGTTGLLYSSYSYRYEIPGPSPVLVYEFAYGNKYCFDMTANNSSLSSILYPTCIKDCGISNFRIMQADGQWKSVINYTQNYQREDDWEIIRSDRSFVYYRGYTLTIPTNIVKNSEEDYEGFVVYPTFSDTDRTDRYVIINPVSIVKKRKTGESESGFIISMPGIKCKADRLRSLLTDVDGHEYLVVPNGWFDRMFGIPYRNLSRGESLLDVISELSSKMIKQRYVLLIDLG